MAEPHLRPYEATDLDACYEICLLTGAAGRDATELFADRRLLGELFMAAYATLEPEHCLVVDDGTGAAQGYLVGTFDTRAFEARCRRDWWPALHARYPGPTGEGVLDDLFIGVLHRFPAAADDVVAEHPAHLHIDLLPPFQSGGWGRRLMATWLDLARAAGVPGVHLGVAKDNVRAQGFYEHLGWTELHFDGVTRTMGIRL